MFGPEILAVVAARGAAPLIPSHRSDRRIVRSDRTIGSASTERMAKNSEDFSENEWQAVFDEFRLFVVRAGYADWDASAMAFPADCLNDGYQRQQALQLCKHATAKRIKRTQRALAEHSVY